MALAPNMGSDPRMLIALETAYVLAGLIFDSGDTISWDECRQSLISKLRTWKQGDALPLFIVCSALRSVVRFDQESRQIKGMYCLNCPDSKAISIAIDLRLDLELVCSKVHCPAPSLGCYRCLWHGTMNQVDKAQFSTRSWCSFPWLPLLMKGWIRNDDLFVTSQNNSLIWHSVCLWNPTYRFNAQSPCISERARNSHT